MERSNNLSRATHSWGAEPGLNPGRRTVVNATLYPMCVPSALCTCSLTCCRGRLPLLSSAPPQSERNCGDIGLERGVGVSRLTHRPLRRCDILGTRSENSLLSGQKQSLKLSSPFSLFKSGFSSWKMVESPFLYLTGRRAVCRCAGCSLHNLRACCESHSR